ncbi:MAG: sulfatase-like hydrolase/transferase, partial [Halobacteriaceae archaeon]
MSRPNILLIILDSVRARNTSLHGYGRSTTPFLKRFAAESTVYTQARAPSIHSISSHASLFSGYHTEEHHVGEHESQLDPAASIWKQLGDKYGYNTGIFSPNLVVMGSSNLAEPFQTQEGPRRNRLFPTAFSPGDTEESSYVNYLLESLHQDQKLKSILNGVFGIVPYSKTLESHDPDAESADVYIDLFLDWIEHQSSPWAGFLNLMDAHYPYIPKPEYDFWGGEKLADIQTQMGTPSREILSGKPIGEFQALESLYDGCIRQLDHYIEYLVGSLKARGEFENTFLAITSDHGEGFAEQSNVNRAVELIDHSWGIHEVLTHVPLIVKYPEQTTGGTVDELASLTE